MDFIDTQQAPGALLPTVRQQSTPGLKRVLDGIRGGGAAKSLWPATRSTRTVFSGSYSWKQVRRLKVSELAPGSYALEATVAGADFPPVTQSAVFNLEAHD